MPAFQAFLRTQPEVDIDGVNRLTVPDDNRRHQIHHFSVASVDKLALIYMCAIVIPGLATMKKAPNQIDIHVGSRIRLGRTRARMTQEQLAEGLGITFQQVQKYEKGSNRVGASRLQHISELLNLPIIFFFEAGPSALVDTADDASHRLSELMNSKESIALATAFHSIEDKHVRRSVLSLVRSLATYPLDPDEIDGTNDPTAKPI